ncbi:hypothetical protein PSECIP111951_03021 [Pseudoalteromonas holothuriae]|uniref:Aminoglycoside phosphotransferase domain-containing protein n=1 Tax=Pseudoalteromonas holothuriae TaxID=2963714 RepID=A0A9W4R5A9_9GAMM|nr:MULTISPECIES: aminoglycoside phosphotransferase family protein [unclassified Pseudoalteromonas]CAH9063997.1 hypothetical protein PSECIP111951_03021 [Pseudoalteromonas sp. CIP111951]CAH9066798.1 hypothetical protein PSECIP111854_03961 [Pseudoalteromonas sp. CIP111854]
MMLEKNSNPIAFGNTCEVFSLPEDKVIKLFHPQINQRHIDHESHMVKQAFQAGLTHLEPGVECQIGERQGLIYNQIKGETMAVMLRKKPWLLRPYIKLFTRCHIALHRRQAPRGFPHLKEELKKKIEQSDILTGELRAKLMIRLREMGTDSRVCHADFHLDNLIINKHKQVTLIDWAGSMQGDVDADVALCWLRMTNISNDVTTCSNIERWILRKFAQGYLRRYLKLRPECRQNVLRWMPLMAFWLISKNHHHHSDFLPNLIDPDQQQYNKALMGLFA